jgi:hypothetical protein
MSHMHACGGYEATDCSRNDPAHNGVSDPHPIGDAMTARTTAPMSPEQIAQQFVGLALPVLQRCRSKWGVGDSVPARLTQRLGGSWSAHFAGQLVDAGRSDELDACARQVSKVFVNQLSLDDRGKLMSHMRDYSEDSEPASFVVVVAISGESWTLSVRACVRQSSAVVGAIEGSFVEPAEPVAVEPLQAA